MINPNLHGMPVRCALLILLVATFGVVPAAQEISSDKWEDDLDFLVRELEKRHENLFHTVEPEKFHAAAETLRTKLPGLKRNQIIVEMARLVALVNDGHTRVSMFRNFTLGQFPLRLYLFDDGLYVREAEVSVSEAVGARVIKIGNLSAEEALEKVFPIASRDNNPMLPHYLAPVFLTKPEVLHGLGIITDTNRAEFVLQHENGSHFTLPLAPLSQGAETEWIIANHASETPLPLYLQRQEEAFWIRHLPESKVLYVQFNQVQNKEGESLAEFADRLNGLLHATQVERLVLDLRLNDGGNSRLALPLLHTIIKNDQINRSGHLFTIIGRLTFSATMVFAAELQKHTNVFFVGEPTGGSPNQYGELMRFSLPHSLVVVEYSGYFFQTAGPFKKSGRLNFEPWIAPHIGVVLTSKDFKNNVDPAFEAIQNYRASPSLSQQLLDALQANGIESLEETYRAFKTNPANKYLNTTREVRLLGDQLLEEKRLKEALQVFQLNAKSYSQRALVYFSLGEFHQARGQTKLARENFEQCLELLPVDPSLHKALKERVAKLVTDILRKLE